MSYIEHIFIMTLYRRCRNDMSLYPPVASRKDAGHSSHAVDMTWRLQYGKLICLIIEFSTHRSTWSHTICMLFFKEVHTPQPTIKSSISYPGLFLEPIIDQLYSPDICSLLGSVMSCTVWAIPFCSLILSNICIITPVHNAYNYYQADI